MGNRLYIGSALIDGRVYIHFRRGRRPFLRHPVFYPDLDDITRPDVGSNGIPGVDEKGVCARHPGAHVPAEIKEPQIFREPATTGYGTAQAIFVHDDLPPSLVSRIPFLQETMQGNEITTRHVSRFLRSERVHSL
jgi:hypothetical protein